MIQQIILFSLFAGAAFYVGRLVYHSFTAKSACESGCAKCGALDLEKIERELKAKGL